MGTLPWINITSTRKQHPAPLGDLSDNWFPGLLDSGHISCSTWLSVRWPGCSGKPLIAMAPEAVTSFRRCGSDVPVRTYILCRPNRCNCSERLPSRQGNITAFFLFCTSWMDSQGLQSAADASQIQSALLPWISEFGGGGQALNKRDLKPTAAGPSFTPIQTPPTAGRLRPLPMPVISLKKK